MKKIKDERLIIRSLENIRIAFLVQTIGIVAILVYEAVTEGIMEIINNPLWLVFMLTLVVLGWLNLRISVDVYDHAKNQRKPGPYYRGVIIALLMGVIIALLARFGPDKSSDIEALIVGGILFICFLIPYTFVYYLRKKRSEDDEI